MIRRFLIAVFVLQVLQVCAFGQQEDKPGLPRLPDVAYIEKQYFFNGKWLPAVDPLTIGPDNFKTLKNMRYTDTAIEGVEGYTRINDTALSSSQDYTGGGFTLYDQSTLVTSVTSSAITLSGVVQTTDAYLVHDAGENHYDYDFTFDFDIVGQPTTEDDSQVFIWALANNNDGSITNNASMGLICEGYLSGATMRLLFRFYENDGSGSEYFSGTYSTSVAYDNKQYLRIKKINNTIKLLWFSSSDRVGSGSAVITYDLVYSQNFRYLYGFCTYNDGDSEVWSGVISNLKEQTTIDNGAQLQTDFTTKSYVLADTPTAVWKNTTAIPSRGDFTTYSLYTKASGASTGRFSKFPGGNIGYANEKESCIWAGDEMLPAGFYTISEVAESFNNVTITGGATDIISFLASEDLKADGFKPGQKITIDSSTTNDGDFTIYTMTTTGIHTVEDLTTEAGAENITITTTRPDKNIIDYTGAVQNELQTTGNYVVLGGGIDDYAELMLHFDGSELSTTFTDSSSNGLSYSETGDTKLRTAIKKFGSAAVYMPATGDALAYTDDSGLNMGTGRFTIETWIYLDNPTATGYIFAQETGGNDRVGAIKSTNYINFVCLAGGVTQWDYTVAWAPSESRWYHLSFIRGWGDNDNTIAITVDGIESGYTTVDSTADWGDFDKWFWINGDFDGNGGIDEGIRYDEFRVTKGIARWTSNFSPMNRPYMAPQLQFIVLSTRPLQGVKTYISEANTLSSTISGEYWTGSGFSDLSLVDGTASSGVSLAQSGTISFSSTATDAEPYHFQGTYYYAYLFTLSDGYADIYFVTVDADFQPIVDIWDGVLRQPSEFQVWDDSEEKYSDYTLEVLAQSTSTSTFGGILDNLAGGEDHIIIMFDERMAGVLLSIANSLSNTETSRPAVDRWSGSAWVDVGEVIDGTISSDEKWNSLGQTGVYSWTPPELGEEKKVSLFGSSGYAYSISYNNDLGSTVTVDTALGIPAQTDIKAFKLPAIYGGRALLVNDVEGKQGNRIDYSVTNLADVWNGFESSMDGYQSIYVGGNEGITAATQIYNKYGSNFYTTLFITKKSESYMIHGTGPDDFRIYPISDNIGCPAPLTMATTKMRLADVDRNIVVFLSYFGVAFFDGATIQLVPGIDNYFDPADSEYINTSLIDSSRGWFDQTNLEYNLAFPSGSSATNCNKWVVLDLKQLKWYEKAPYSDYPQAGWPVYDTDGFQYIYGGTDTGYMLRMDTGTMWNDQPITHTWETGDFFPSGNIWDLFLMERFKMFAPGIDESATVSITMYTDTASSIGKALSGFVMDSGSTRINRDVQPLNQLAWSYRLQYSVTMGDGSGADARALNPLGWGYRGYVKEKDIYN